MKFILSRMSCLDKDLVEAKGENVSIKNEITLRDERLGADVTRQQQQQHNAGFSPEYVCLCKNIPSCTDCRIIICH